MSLANDMPSSVALLGMRTDFGLAGVAARQLDMGGLTCSGPELFKSAEQRFTRCCALFVQPLACRATGHGATTVRIAARFFATIVYHRLSVWLLLAI